MYKDLKLIKKKYGESMMHLCRELFPTILEKEGLLCKILFTNFEISKNLYNDIKLNNLELEFENFINSKLKIENKQHKTDKDPFSLMEDAGYELYECKTKNDIEKFRKYYKEDELLCTFKDKNRLSTNYIFFATKKDVDKIKREDFKNPKREDLYGTSVISIQFTKGKNNYLSIKNRYNHTVNNPDATYSNDLDKIIKGLKYSFEKYYNLNISNCKMTSFEIPNYVVDINNKMHKYYYEINNIYYCENNIIIDNGQVIDKYKDKEKYLFLDYFIIDLMNKKIFLYDENINDSFINSIGNINKITILNKSLEKQVLIESDNKTIEIVLKDNCIIKYIDNNIVKIENNFLYYSKYLNNIELDSVEKIEDCFLCHNENLETIKLNKVRKIGKNFLFNNVILKSIYLDNTEIIGDNFLYNNILLKIIKADNLKEVGDCFLSNNLNLEYLKLLTINKIGDYSLLENNMIKELYIPNIEVIGSYFLYKNEVLDTLIVNDNVTYSDGCLMKTKFNKDTINKVKVLKLN